MRENYSKRLTELLGIEHPIIQAPLFAGESVELITLISEAGALGTINGLFMELEQLEERITAIREETDRPFAVALSAQEIQIDSIAKDNEFYQRLDEFMQVVGVMDQSFDFSYRSALSEEVNLLIEHEVAAVIFQFGIPSFEIIERLQEAGIAVIGQATHMIEALLWQDAGADALILQGVEGGGIRGTFIGEPLNHLHSSQALLMQAEALLRLPLIIGGGIFRYEQLVSALMLGADGVAVGTAFMMSKESALSLEQKEIIWQSNEYDSHLTEEWSGRLGRAVMNRGLHQLRAAKGNSAPFPLQMRLVGQIVEKITDIEQYADYAPLWAGEHGALCDDFSVSELIDSLTIEGARERIINNEWPNELQVEIFDRLEANHSSEPLQKAEDDLMGEGMEEELADGRDEERSEEYIIHFEGEEMEQDSELELAFVAEVPQKE